MPFREWMRRALFDPERGYYSHHARTVGRRGDFSTSATTGTALGEAVASWLKGEFARTGKVSPLWRPAAAMDRSCARCGGPWAGHGAGG